MNRIKYLQSRDEELLYFLRKENNVDKVLDIQIFGPSVKSEKTLRKTILIHDDLKNVDYDTPNYNFDKEISWLLENNNVNGYDFVIYLTFIRVSYPNTITRLFWETSTLDTFQLKKSDITDKDIRNNTKPTIMERNDYYQVTTMEIRDIVPLQTDYCFYRDKLAAEDLSKYRDYLFKPPPKTYICNRCYQQGHWYQECPLLNKK